MYHTQETEIQLQSVFNRVIQNISLLGRGQNPNNQSKRQAPKQEQQHRPQSGVTNNKDSITNTDTDREYIHTGLTM